MYVGKYNVLSASWEAVCAYVVFGFLLLNMVPFPLSDFTTSPFGL